MSRCRHKLPHDFVKMFEPDYAMFELKSSLNAAITEANEDNCQLFSSSPANPLVYPLLSASLARFGQREMTLFVEK